MKTVILYKSAHGATKQYAEWIHEELKDSDIFSVDDSNVPNLSGYDAIIIGSSVYSGKMPGLEFLQSNWDQLRGKNVFYFTVGLIPPDDAYSRDMYETIPPEIRDGIEYIKLPGQITYRKPNLVEKWSSTKFAHGDMDSRIDKAKIEPIVKWAEMLAGKTIQ